MLSCCHFQSTSCDHSQCAALQRILVEMDENTLTAAELGAMLRLVLQPSATYSTTQYRKVPQSTWQPEDGQCRLAAVAIGRVPQRTRLARKPGCIGSHESPAALARTKARLHWLARKPGCIGSHESRKPGCIDGHRHGTFAFGSIGPLPAACKPSLASGGDECIGSLANARQPPLYAEPLP